MNTFRSIFYSSKHFYSLPRIIALLVILMLGFVSVSEVSAGNTDTVILAVGGGAGGPGGGGGGAGGGGGNGQGGEGEGEEPVQGNNLSFPAIAADGYVIAPIASSSFTVPYDGPYTDLSVEEMAVLEGRTWYAQKTEGNTWQAAYTTATTGDPVAIFGVDWGDNIESVNPIVGNPFRLEVGLYDKPELPMLGYTMALLANPSSPDEVQGTDGTSYESEFAVVVSEKPKLAIQDITDVCTTDLTWEGSAWALDGVNLADDDVSFAPELNVGGKYVYGASQGGWRPTNEGMYRITMYMADSDISLVDAVIGNYADWTASTSTTEEDEETGAAIPVIDALHNLTFVDVTTGSSGGGGNPGDSETDPDDPCAVIDDTPATTTDPDITDDDESSSSSSGGSSSSRRTTPTGEVAGVSISQFVTQDDIDLQRSVLIDRVTLVNLEHAKLLTLIANGTASQEEINLQKSVVLGHIKAAQSEYLKLLQLMLLNKLQALVAKLQSGAQ